MATVASQLPPAEWRIPLFQTPKCEIFALITPSRVLPGKSRGEKGVLFVPALSPSLSFSRLQFVPSFQCCASPAGGLPQRGLLPCQSQPLVSRREATQENNRVARSTLVAEQRTPLTTLCPNLRSRLNRIPSQLSDQG